MIKPGTICMVRGVPKNQLGYDCNGKIVTAVELVFADIYRIEPALVTQQLDRVVELTGSRECYLHPLGDFEPEVTITAKVLEPA